METEAFQSAIKRFTDNVRKKPGYLPPLLTAIFWIMGNFLPEGPYRYACFLGIGLSLCWALYIYHRTAIVIKDPQADTPSSVKGVYPFTEADQVLFSKLERQAEIRKLIGLIQDTQNGVLVLIGDECSGKTSLLRAGLRPWLAQQNIDSAYCDAYGRNPVQCFIEAVRSELGIEFLPDLSVTWPIKKRSVMIIDGLERLGLPLEADDPILRLLRQLSDRTPPQKFQLILSLRSDHIEKWSLFKRANSLQCVEVLLDLLSTVSAQEVVEVLLEEAGVSLDRAIIRDYIKHVASPSGVSPIDIAVLVGILEKRARNRVRRRLRFQADYAETGGAQGVMLSDIRECLKNFDPATSSALIRAITDNLAAFIEGMPATEINKITGAGVSDTDIDALASNSIRLLKPNFKAAVVEYSLARASLITVFPELGREEFSGPDNPALLFLRDRYGWWNRTRNPRDLLRGAELKLATKCLDSSTLHELAGFKDYVDRSSRAHHWRISAKAALAAFVVAVGVLGFWFTTSFKQETRLQSWRLPSELYSRQYRLRELKIQGYGITGLEWLRGSRIHDLEITGALLDSISGLDNLRGLQSVTLDLHGMSSHSLQEIAKLPLLNTLKLSLGHTTVSDLTDLSGATGIRNLSLELGGSNIVTIDDLEKLDHLMILELDLPGSQLANLSVIPRIRSLRVLRLHIDSSQIQLLSDLNEATNLEELDLTFETVRKQVPGQSIPRDLAGFIPPKALKKLSVRFRGPVVDFSNPSPGLDHPPVENLSSLLLPRMLEELCIDLGGYTLRGLPSIKELPELESLTLRVHGSQLKQMPDLEGSNRLNSLHFSGDSRQLSELKIWNLKGIQELGLDMYGRFNLAPAVSSFKALKRLELELSDANVRDLNEVSKLTTLRELDLHLTWPQLADLGALGKLRDLAALNLTFIGLPYQSIPQLNIGHALPRISLSFAGTTLEQLPKLDQFRDVENLAIDISGSSMKSLDALQSMSSVRDLAIDVTDVKRIDRLPPIFKLPQLRSLYLVADGSQISDFSTLGYIRTLSDFKLSLRNANISSIDTLRSISGLREVVLDQRVHSLVHLPSSVEGISFISEP